MPSLIFCVFVLRTHTNGHTYHGERVFPVSNRMPFVTRYELFFLLAFSVIFEAALVKNEFHFICQKREIL
jgi:hypothetical protein